MRRCAAHSGCKFGVSQRAENCRLVLQHSEMQTGGMLRCMPAARTSTRVCAWFAAGAAGRAETGGDPSADRSRLGPACSRACTRSRTVSASPMVWAGRLRTRNARSIRRTSSVRPRLSIPRSRSIRLDGTMSINLTRCGCSSHELRNDLDQVTFAHLSLVHRGGSCLIRLLRHKK